MKNILQFSAALVSAFLLASCSGNTEQSSNAATTTTEVTNSTSAAASNQGKGSITLVCNGHTFVNAGNCNYSSQGDCIVVADSADNRNVFTLNLSGGLPSATKTYPLTEGLPTSANEAGISFVRFPATGKMFNWDASKNVGSVTLTVEGNKINCSFSDIKLKPSAMYNPDSLNHPGICLGSFALYK